MSFSAICDPNEESCPYDSQAIVECKQQGSGFEQVEDVPPECLPITA